MEDMNTDLLRLVPGFGQGIVRIHDTLQPIAQVIAFGGLTLIAVIALHRERALNSILPYLFKVFIVALVITNLGVIGDWLEDLVDNVAQSSGFNSGNVFTYYTQALQNKFGIDFSALGALNPIGNQSGPATGAGKITAYGFKGDLTPDGNSNNGVGNHGNQLVAFGSGAPASAALSADMAQKYGVALGQNFTVVGSNGQTYNLNYADSPRSDLTGIVDIYDPNSLLSANDNNFSSGLSSLSVGSLAQNSNPIQSFFQSVTNPSEVMTSAIFGVICLILSFIAVACMFIMDLVQSILFFGYIALGPIYVAFFLVPGVYEIGKNFLLGFVAVCLWPLGWVVASLVTRFFIALAINSGNNGAQAAGNMATGMNMAFWIIVAVWVVFQSFAVPIFISRLMRGNNVMANMLLGGAAAMAVVYRGVSSAATAVAAPASGASGAAMSASGRMPSFARRSGFKEKP
jgi:hypothetical protein